MARENENDRSNDDDDDLVEIDIEDDDEEESSESVPHQESLEINDDLFTAKKAAEEKEVEEEVDEQEEERKQFGKRAEKRIKTLLAEKKALEARVAKIESESIKRKREEAESQKNSVANQMAQMETREKELDALKITIDNSYRQAREANDIDAELAAQEASLQLSGERQAIANAKRFLESKRTETDAWDKQNQVKTQTQNVDPTQTYVQPNEVNQSKPDANALKWWNENQWFRGDSTPDRIKTFKAQEIHESLMQEGFDPNNDPDDYYKELDARLLDEFPDLHDESKMKTKKKVSPVTGGGRANSRKAGGKDKVQLTRTMVEYAKRNGIPLKEYAKQVQKLRDQGRDI